MISDSRAVTPKKRKNNSTKPLQELSLNNMLNSKYNKSSNKKPLKRRLSISDEEEKDYESCQFSATKGDLLSSKKASLLSKFREVDREDRLQLSDLPTELHYLILDYLPCENLLKVVQLLSKYWRAILLESSFWKSKPLNLSQRLRKVVLLAERRSKGKQFKAIDRITNENRTVRRVFLDVTNAGQDDGLPTSVLREISYLKSLNHNNVTR